MILCSKHPIQPLDSCVVDINLVSKMRNKRLCCRQCLLSQHSINHTLPLKDLIDDPMIIITQCQPTSTLGQLATEFDGLLNFDINALFNEVERQIQYELAQFRASLSNTQYDIDQVKRLILTTRENFSRQQLFQNLKSSYIKVQENQAPLTDLEVHLDRFIQEVAYNRQDDSDIQNTYQNIRQIQRNMQNINYFSTMPHDSMRRTQFIIQEITNLYERLESTIERKNISELMDWRFQNKLEQRIGKKIHKFQKIYDSDLVKTTETVQRLLDQKSQTLILMQLDNGHVIGGYAHPQWNLNAQVSDNDHRSFLFSISNQCFYYLKPEKRHNAITLDPNRSLFEFANDLIVTKDKKVQSQLDDSYSLEGGQNPQLMLSKNLFGETRCQQIVRLQIFHYQQEQWSNPSQTIRIQQEMIQQQQQMEQPQQNILINQDYKQTSTQHQINQRPVQYQNRVDVDLTDVTQPRKLIQVDNKSISQFSQTDQNQLDSQNNNTKSDQKNQKYVFKKNVSVQQEEPQQVNCQNSTRTNQPLVNCQSTNPYPTLPTSNQVRQLEYFSFSNLCPLSMIPLIENELKVSNQQFSFLYHSKFSGYDNQKISEQFYTKNNTIILIKLEDNEVIGAFCPECLIPGEAVEDLHQRSFLFSITKHEIYPIIHANQQFVQIKLGDISKNEPLLNIQNNLIIHNNQKLQYDIETRYLDSDDNNTNTYLISSNGIKEITEFEIYQCI